MNIIAGRYFMKDFAVCFLYCLTSLVGETGGTWIYMDYQDIIRAVFDHGLMTMSSLRIFLNWKCTSWDFTNSYADRHKKMYNKPVSGYQPRCNSKEKTNNPPHHIFHDYQKMLVIYDFSSADVHVPVSEEKISPDVICFYEVTLARI